MKKTTLLAVLGLGVLLVVYLADPALFESGAPSDTAPHAPDTSNLRPPVAGTQREASTPRDAGDTGQTIPLKQPADGGETSASPEPATAMLIVYAKGRLSLRVRNQSLAAVLDEISRQSGIAITSAPDLNGESVSIEFQDLPLAEGLQRLLHTWDAFYFYGGASADPVLQAIWVYPRGVGAGIVPVPPESWASSADIETNLTATQPGQRAAALEAIVERKGQQAQDAVLNALADTESSVRTRALELAVNFGLVIPLDTLVGIAQSDPTPTLRMRALDAILYPRLANGTPAADIASIIEPALNDPEPKVRAHARALLRELRETGDTTPETQSR